MKRLYPYLNFAGNTREALEFYKKCLNGEITRVQTYGEANMQVEDKYKDNILHSEFRAEAVEFMAADVMPGDSVAPGDMVTMCINLDDAKEQERIFNALAEGGKVQYPLEKTFWGAIYGQLLDRYGIPWMLNCEVREGEAAQS